MNILLREKYSYSTSNLYKVKCHHIIIRTLITYVLTNYHNTDRATGISKIDLTKAFEQITASKDYAP